MFSNRVDENVFHSNKMMNGHTNSFGSDFNDKITELQNSIGTLSIQDGPWTPPDNLDNSWLVYRSLYATAK